MLIKSSIMEEAMKLGFEDVGFTTAETFIAQREYLWNHQEEYVISRARPLGWRLSIAL